MCTAVHCRTARWVVQRQPAVACPPRASLWQCRWGPRHPASRGPHRGTGTGPATAHVTRLPTGETRPPCTEDGSVRCEDHVYTVLGIQPDHRFQRRWISPRVAGEARGDRWPTWCSELHAMLRHISNHSAAPTWCMPGPCALAARWMGQCQCGRPARAAHAGSATHGSAVAAGASRPSQRRSVLRGTTHSAATCVTCMGELLSWRLHRLG